MKKFTAKKLRIGLRPDMEKKLETIAENLVQRFSAEKQVFKDELNLTVKPEQIVDICFSLRDPSS